MEGTRPEDVDVYGGFVHKVSFSQWVQESARRGHVVLIVLGSIGAVILFVVLLLSWWAFRRGRRRRAVPLYWQNAGCDLRHGDDKASKNYFDDAYPVSMEQRMAFQDLMNATCSDEDLAFRLVRVVRVESSSLWLRYRRKLIAIKKDRVECEFQGEGGPSLRRKADDLDLTELSCFGQKDLDEDVCESFLWLGTKPETAMKVMHSGELLEDTEVVGSAARFGEGWYFAEDTALANKKAQPGEHLYHDCFAMLLCRVVLGRQQLVDAVAATDSEAAAPPSTSVTSSSVSGRTLGATSISGRGGSRPDFGSAASSLSEDSRRRVRLSSHGSVGSATPDGDEALAVGHRQTRLGRLTRKMMHLGTGSATSRARARPGSAEDYDSTLAEIADEPREFTVYNSQQVYPEFALVYERCHPDTLEHGVDGPSYWDHARSMIFGSIYPPYWKNCRPDAPEDFHDLFPALRFKSMIQDLANDTWLAKRTRDRRGRDGLPIPKGDPNGDMPIGIRVLKGWRVENSEMWTKYQTFMSKVVEVRAGAVADVEVKTNKKLPFIARRRLNAAANEAYLWHGSSPRAVMGIASHGFNLDMAGSNMGQMFGRGAYFAECSSKADEYSQDDKEGYFQGCFAMVLCRVILGEAQVLREADYCAHENLGFDQAYDSTIGDRESAVGTYREFIVPTQAAVYPEYAIIYERLFRQGPRVRGCVLEPGTPTRGLPDWSKLEMGRRLLPRKASKEDHAACSDSDTD